MPSLCSPDIPSIHLEVHHYEVRQSKQFLVDLSLSSMIRDLANWQSKKLLVNLSVCDVVTLLLF